MRVEAAALSEIEVHGRGGLLLRLTDDAGRVGWGEASPLPGYSADDLPTAALALRGLPERLGDLDPGAGAVTAATGALARLDGELAGSPSARFALETGLLDLLGQRNDRSIADCLGGRRSYPDVARNALLTASAGARSLVAQATAIAARGIGTLKVKLRARDAEGFARELSALEAVRAALPAPFELRVDANGAWGIDEARARLAELARLGLELAEQPTAPELLADLGPCAVPWAADESLRVAGMPERLLGAAGCAAFVLKPQVLGLVHAYELGRRAQERGLEVVVTHLFDGPVGMAAACELALAFPRAPLACGLDPHDPGMTPIPQLEVAGRVTRADRPGLGLAAVRAYAKERSAAR